MRSIQSVSRENYILADGPWSVYAAGDYISRDKPVIRESIFNESLRIAPDGDRKYFAARMYQRLSEDNGKTWRELPGNYRDPINGEAEWQPAYSLHPKLNVLVRYNCTYLIDDKQAMFSGTGIRLRSYRPFIELSHDEGKTWGERQFIHDSKPGCDATQMVEGVRYKTSGLICNHLAWLPDGSAVGGFTIYCPVDAAGRQIAADQAEGYYQTIFAHGVWNADHTRLSWTFGERVDLPPWRSPRGGCEVGFVALGGMQLWATMRCQGDPDRGIFTVPYSVHSTDAGQSWSEPMPLLYDDETPCWLPASLVRYYTQPKTGAIYLLANIIQKPSYDQVPRYPLCLARLDPKKRRIIRDSVLVVQDKPAGAPVDRRYTNWGAYFERGSDDFIITLPEMPRKKNYEEMVAEDFDSDCVRYRVKGL